MTVRIRPPRTLWTGPHRTGAPPLVGEGRYAQPVMLSPWGDRSATVVVTAAIAGNPAQLWTIT
ncbi:hypothetical protein [Kitasatospora sp. NPDC088346]|uniref:hypothetical protein n=1 Tax=Kitasatospora sp. NPDC088346 TaxID=3364073 RepID=UPI00382ECD3B